MMLKAMRYLCLGLVLLTAQLAVAQNISAISDSLISKMNGYGAKTTSTTMFVHLDKTVYVNNEMMWFSAYLLNSSAADLPTHQVLSVALVNNNDQAIAAQGKFTMANGMGFGNLSIPDTIPPGSYSFIASTNRLVNGHPAAVFVQPVTLKTVTQASFNVQLTLDTAYKDAGLMHVLLQASVKSKPINAALINYFLGKDARTRVAGKAKTNVIGSYDVLIPKSSITPQQHQLDVLVKYNKEVAALHLNIPIKQQPTDVKFYPEGGHLVNGLPNNVGWEVKTPTGTAIKTKGVLYAGSRAIDTIETDSYGMGHFSIIPQGNLIYAVKLLPAQGGERSYNLPPALNKGLTLYTGNAIANDTLRVQLRTKYIGAIFFLVHNYNQVFIANKLKATQQGLLIKADLAQVPRGLNTITILDSLQRPLAERLVFTHYSQKPKVSIRMDNKVVATRQKVTVQLKLNSFNGKPGAAIVSVGCAQDSRFEVKNDNNIEHYAYLQNQIENLPLKDDLLANNQSDHNYLNELLLVRGWRKYNWADMARLSPGDTVQKKDSLTFGGIVTRFGNKLKKPVQLLMIKDSAGINMFGSDAQGAFNLSNADMESPADKKLHLIVSGQSDEYAININDPYIPVNKNLAREVEPAIYEAPLNKSTDEFVLKGFEHATNLREVKITASNQNALYGNGKGATVNACGDYVCPFHILNCPNHPNNPGNHAPLEGELVVVLGQARMLYQGCSTLKDKAEMLSFAGIYTGREFYGADYTTINPTEPDYLSTIYWQHHIKLSTEKETEISFYTSDISGLYRLVLQGVTNEDVVYGQYLFNVNNKLSKQR